MPITVTGLDFTTLPTDDIEAARRFYGETLGLPFLKQWGEMPGLEFVAGEQVIAVMDPRAFGAGEPRPHGVPVALAVDDVAAARAELEAAGVAFLGETMDSGVCHQALFRDPFGNVLDLHHRYAPPTPLPGK